MKKLLAVMLIIFLIFIGISPYLSGLYFKNKQNDYVAALNKMLHGKATLTLIDYRTGWLTSLASYKLSFLDARYSKTIEYVTISERIQHGPLLVDMNPFSAQFAVGKVWLDFSLPSEMGRIARDLHSQFGSIFQLQGVMYGGSHIQIMHKTKDMSDPMMGDITKTHSLLDIYVNPTVVNPSHISMQFMFDGLEAKGGMTSPGYALRISPMKIIAEYTKNNDGLWNITSMLSLHHVNATMPDTSFLIDNIIVDGSILKNTSNQYDLNRAVSVDAITINSKKYDKPVNLTMHLKNIHPDGIIKLKDIIQSNQPDVDHIQGSLLSLLNANTTADMSFNLNLLSYYLDMNMKAYFANLPANSPLTQMELNTNAAVDVSFTFSDEMIKAIMMYTDTFAKSYGSRLHFSSSQDMARDQLPTNAMPMNAGMMKMPTLDDLIQVGFIVNDNGHYKMTMSVRGKTVLINNVDPDELMTKLKALNNKDVPAEQSAMPGSVPLPTEQTNMPDDSVPLPSASDFAR